MAPLPPHRSQPPAAPAPGTPVRAAGYRSRLSRRSEAASCTAASSHPARSRPGVLGQRLLFHDALATRRGSGTAIRL
eukprot:397576-Hanusia_phi.AAC.1